MDFTKNLSAAEMSMGSGGWEDELAGRYKVGGEDV